MFGKFLCLKLGDKFPAKLAQQLVLRQVKCDDNSELAFKFGNKKMVMGITDFILITGLNCKLEIFRKKLTRPTVSILEKYFEEKPVTLGALQYMFEAGVEILAKAPNEDVIRMTNLYYNEKLIVSNQNKLKVNEQHLKLVYDDEELKK
ncbi:hypothetical protein TIFTF001_015291 [Ficus carica]|uniref:DUF1985 domain-containing protein n=1 Tax=Ficus carica TaxID=3494 RepID=A0AA88D7R3_FICCA|nr:hypothetical protein TIFTF001_015291 [Ficus carica]